MSNRKRMTGSVGPESGPWPLPEGWQWKALGTLGKWFGGGTPSKAVPEFWQNGTIPWVSPKDMKRPIIKHAEDSITEYALFSSAARIVPAQSVLLVVRSGILAHSLPVAINSVPVAMNQDMRALFPDADVLPQYVAHYLRSSQQEILYRCSKQGTTVASIETGRLGAFPVPVCDIPTQRRIVEEIELLFADIDDGETALGRARADLEVYRRALLKAAVTGELTAAWRAANPPKETGTALLARILATRRARWQADPRNIGRSYREPTVPAVWRDVAHPDGWTWATLPQLGDFGRGKSKHRPRDDARLYGGPYPFVQTGVVSSSNGKITSYSQTYSEIGLAQSKLWPAGTLCITIAANIAKSGVLTFKACFPDSVVGITCAEGVLPAYLHLVISDLQALLERNAPATAQKNINLDVLEQIAIPLPPLEEQQEIVARFDDCMVAAEMVSCEELDDAFSSIRQSILSAAFRGVLL